MPKRVRITLDEVAEWPNLLRAAYRASKGKRLQTPVQRFFENLDENLFRMGQEIRNASFRPGPFRRVEIHDPKTRLIHAPPFRDRVMHHALMHYASPWIDRLLIDDSYACRIGKGAIAAVQRAQHFSRRYKWYAKVDVRQYFASIDQQVLFTQLTRRFSDPGFQELLHTIISCFEATPGRGLPIGALTSQHFANLYLTPADRWLSSIPQVHGIVRYMDDTVSWFQSKQAAVSAVAEFTVFLERQLGLELSKKPEVNRVSHGLTFCGYRIFPGTIKLTRRKQRLYVKACRKCERKYLSGEISDLELQAGYASAYAISKHAASAGWRREQTNRSRVSEA